MGAELRIDLLGHFRITRGDTPVTGVHARQQGLLAYLLLNRQRSHSRHELASIFWPDSGDGQALTNLRRELLNLRRALPDADSPIVADAETVRWNQSSACACDVLDFEAAIRRGDLDSLQQAGDLYRGDLLPGCSDEWVVREREYLRRRCIDGLRALVVMLEERRAYADGITYAERILALEPFDEDACRALMRLYALKGDRAAALHTFRTFATRLEQEISAQPDTETRAAYQQLIDATEEPSRETAQLVAPSLIGRRPQWKELLETWRAAAAGRPGFALIRGEAGIGKTRLAEELLEWCGRQGVRTARTRSYAAEGGLPYGPIIDWLRSPAFKAARAQLDAPWRAEVSRLLPEVASERAGLRPTNPMTEPWQRQHLFEALLRAVLLGRGPLLLMLDDLQWCDKDTLEWLHYALRAQPDGRLLIVGTLRTEEEPDNPGLRAFVRDLRALDRLVEIDLGPLSDAETASLAAQVTGRNLDPDLAARVFQRTHGYPLFVVEMARGGLDASPSLPPKMHAIIGERLSHLSPGSRDVAQLAATVGRDFHFDVMREASNLDDAELAGALDELWQRRIIRELGVLTYDFSHDIVRELSYAEIPPATNHLLHRRVAQALELVHASDLDSVSAQVAAHYEQAGRTQKAIQYYRRAADVAGRVSALEDVIRYLSRVLHLLRDQPPGVDRDQEELAILRSLSRALGGARGYFSPEIEAASARMRVLGEALGDPVAVVEGLVGLASVSLLRGRYEDCRKQAQRALAAAEQLGPAHDTLVASGHYISGTVPFTYGELQRAGFHFREVPRLCDPDRPHLLVIGPDVLMFSAAFDAHVLWLAGYPEQAAEQAEAAIERAKRIGHPLSTAVAYSYASLFHQLRRDRSALLTHATKTIEICSQYGIIYYREWGPILLGWAQSETEPEAGTVAIREGLRVLQRLDAYPRRGYYLGLLAQALWRAGRAEEARGTLDAALSHCAQFRDQWWASELHRMRGEMHERPERWFRLALEVARSQGAKSLELRAAVSLARLELARGEEAAARAVLAPIYEWFTEGASDVDLIEARAVLSRL
jgi:DNA-binding SARP family transcriptional activator